MRIQYAPHINEFLDHAFNPLPDNKIFRLIQIETYSCRRQFKVHFKQVGHGGSGVAHLSVQECDTKIC